MKHQENTRSIETEISDDLQQERTSSNEMVAEVLVWFTLSVLIYFA